LLRARGGGRERVLLSAIEGLGWTKPLLRNNFFSLEMAYFGEF